MKAKNKKFFSVMLIFALCILLSSCQKDDDDKPLACLSFIDNNDDFTQTVADTLTEQLQNYGYRTYVTFCGGDVREQSIEIMNFITNEASIIIVDCAGESDVYEELFKMAILSGCRIAVLSNEDGIENCSVQVVNYSVSEGKLMCELVSGYLDEEYADAKPGTVKVMLLATITKKEHIKAYAGYCLLSEKFLRYFDVENLCFEKMETGEQAYYRDAYGTIIPVNEPAGGLILDSDGYAVLNPYYDDRVELKVYSTLNLQTALDGQNAIDVLITKGEGINVVIAMNGNVAVGAAERLHYYNNMKIIDVAAEKLAVFGEGDTVYNRELVLKSVSNESLIRGFVGRYKIEWEADRIIYALLYGKDKEILQMDSLCSVMTPNRKEVGIVTKLTRYGNVIDNPNVFFNEH